MTGIILTYFSLLGAIINIKVGLSGLLAWVYVGLNAIVLPINLMVNVGVQLTSPLASGDN